MTINIVFIETQRLHRVVKLFSRKKRIKDTRQTIYKSGLCKVFFNLKLILNLDYYLLLCFNVKTHVF